MSASHTPDPLFIEEAVDLLEWIAVFADVRSKDDSKTFARVNRGALRTIRDKAQELVAKARGTVPTLDKGDM